MSHCHLTSQPFTQNPFIWNACCSWLTQWCLSLETRVNSGNFLKLNIVCKQNTLLSNIKRQNNQIKLYNSLLFFLSTIWNEWTNSAPIPAVALIWSRDYRVKRSLGVKGFFPAFLQFDMCPAWLAFPKLNAGIAIPTANVNKRAGKMKDHYNLVFATIHSLTHSFSILLWISFFLFLPLPFFLSILSFCLFSVKTTSFNVALLNVFLCRVKPTWIVSLLPKSWHLLCWLSSQYIYSTIDCTKKLGVGVSTRNISK